MFRNPFRKKPDESATPPEPTGLRDWLVSPRGTIQREKVLPKDAYARWQEHRERFVHTGQWPLIVPAEHLEGFELAFKDQAQSVEDDIAMGLNFSAEEFFSGRLQERREDEEEYPDDDAEYRTDFDFDPTVLVRSPPRPTEAQIGALGELLKFNGSKDGIWIALVPCREPWEVPAVLGYGGWNACPMPAEHVAVFRYWNEKHGAVPLVIGHDTIELLVDPVEDPEEAKQVAIEQFLYCDDIVDQGAGSLEEMAGGLLGASVWFFWWD